MLKNVLELKDDFEKEVLATNPNAAKRFKSWNAQEERYEDFMAQHAFDMFAMHKGLKALQKHLEAKLGSDDNQ